MKSLVSLLHASRGNLSRNLHCVKVEPRCVSYSLYFLRVSKFFTVCCFSVERDAVAVMALDLCTQPDNEK